MAYMKLAGAELASLCAAVLVGSAIAAAAPASACHRFSVWKYPYPQRCSFHVKQRANTESFRLVAQRPSMLASAQPERKAPESEQVTNCTEFCAGWPSLEGIDWSKQEESGRLKGIGLLREYYGTN